MSKVEQVMNFLKERGYRRTSQRELIAGVLNESDDALTAKEIHQRVARDFPNMSLDTVYRNLELLREAGLVSQINLQSRESAKFELLKEDDHHHHLICTQCGISVCLPICALDPKHIDAATEAEFTVESHAYELYGRCRDCVTPATK